ncbi:Dynein regulatory complex subunit 4 [Saguinus oedipus]|uniref:Dynein regulatory complex subunit 4 n=1 Tax=Saguinus oedipus TaxID=9490 RepID=A0ABQ9TNJ6_SAGOE|nr:Dynein regulatory complex subunit 4 [Saguinus oedipus]
MKAEGTVIMKLAQKEHHTQEGALRKDMRALKVELKEQELANEVVVKNLRLKHAEEITKLRNDFERQVREIEAKYDKKMKMLRDELDLRRKTELHEVEERKNGQINTLMQRHEEAFTDIKNYYNDITLNNLALISSLKEQMEDMRKKEDRLEREMAEVSVQNKRLADPLLKAREEMGEMQKQLANYERDKQTLLCTKARLKVTEKELKDLQWEHEVLEQRFTKVQQERDELYQKFTAAIQEVQQKTGFKNLVLERKLQALSAAVEKKEVQFNEVLAASNLDPASLTLVSRKLETPRSTTAGGAFMGFLWPENRVAWMSLAVLADGLLLSALLKSLDLPRTLCDLTVLLTFPGPCVISRCLPLISSAQVSRPFPDPV